MYSKTKWAPRTFVKEAKLFILLCSAYSIIVPAGKLQEGRKRKDLKLLIIILYLGVNFF